MDFAKTLMNHVVNDTRTSVEHVNTAFHDWRAAVDEQASVDAYMSDEYISNVETPRAERMRMYMEYCNEKQRLYDIYKFAPNNQKSRALRDWLSYPLPEEIKHGIIGDDYVYTKNVMAYK